MNIKSALVAAKKVATSKAGLTVLRTQKHSPTIMFGAGVVGVVGTVVLASRATLHVNEVLENFEDELQVTRELAASSPELYTEKKMQHDHIVLRTRLVLEISKSYAPTVILGVVSIAALTGAHVTLTRRNAALTASLVAVDKAFKEYRERVREELGEDKDRLFMYGSSSREEVTENKKGETKVEKVTTFGDGSSPYSKLFGSSNYNYQNTIEGNGWFLRTIQNHVNDQLKAKGYVLLNDVYRELGMKDTKAGCVVGWVWNNDNGDQYIDFGCWKERERGGFNPFNIRKDGEILLDFNVDGPIYDTLGNPNN